MKKQEHEIEYLTSYLTFIKEEKRKTQRVNYFTNPLSPNSD